MTGTFVYDPARPDFQDRAYEIYRVLRDEHPVYHCEQAGFWALSRFEDVRAAADDPQTFSSEGTDTSQGLLPMIQALDPPRHDVLRQLVSKAFTPRRVSELEPGIRRIARELIDGFAGDGEVDLLDRFARHLPSLVFGELLGVPHDRREKFLAWTQALVEAKPGSGSAESQRHPAIKIYQEFAQLLAERQERPGDDLMSALLDAEIDGRRLSEEELLGFCFVLIVAGNDTTTNLIANGAALLADHPEQRKLLVESPAAHPERHRGDAAFRVSRAGAAAHRAPARRAARRGDPGRGVGAARMGIGEPRRAGVRGAGPLRRHPRDPPPPRLRPGRALLPRREPGPTRGARGLRGAAGADSRVPARASGRAG